MTFGDGRAAVSGVWQRLMRQAVVRWEMWRWQRDVQRSCRIARDELNEQLALLAQTEPAGLREQIMAQVSGRCAYLAGWHRARTDDAGREFAEAMRAVGLFLHTLADAERARATGSDRVRSEWHELEAAVGPALDELAAATLVDRAQIASVYSRVCDGAEQLLPVASRDGLLASVRGAFAPA